MIELVPASAQCLDQYNSLIVRSKSVWAWPEGYLDAALPLLQVTPVYLNASHSFEVRFGSELAGFCALTIEDAKPLLDHLWIDPDYTGRGAGRTAAAHLIALAAATDATGIDVWPDPPSEGFYTTIGFKPSGEDAPSRVSGGPTFQRYRLTFDR